jgi:choline dehydrogenase-like flavoprotein
VSKAVVVGSGASGGTVARLLAKGGYQVVILEKGRNPFIGLGGPASAVRNNWANDEIAHEARQGMEDQDDLLEPRSFRSQGYTGGPRQFVGEVNTLPTVVGGGTTHYDAKARRLREVDFIANSLLRGYESPSVDPSPDTSAIPNANYANWPMEYRHLEAFYAVSEEVVGVQGPASGTPLTPGGVPNPNKAESWRSTPFPVPPGTPQLNSVLAAWAGVSLGYTTEPIAVPTSIVSRPYVDGRPACVDCGFCLDFGCPINAKGGGVWQVNDAIRAGAELISQANVTSFEYGVAPSGRQVVTAVHFLFAGGQADVVMAPGASAPYVAPASGRNTIMLSPGDVLILANTPIEATRLSLASGIIPGGSFEPSGMLGKNLMFHLQTTALAIVDRNVHSFRGRTSSHTLDAFLGAGPSAKDFVAQGGAAVPRGGITELGGNENPVQAASRFAPFMHGAPLKALMALGPLSKHLVACTLQGEDMPQSGNAVDLDPDIVDVYGQPVPRITYSNHPYELAAAAYYAPKLVELLEAIGAPPSPYPGIHPVFAASINTTIPAASSSTVPVDNVLSQAGSTLASNPTPFGDIPASAHILGTHRMALDQDHGPCDPFGRYWAFDNLYHAGGGLYVTSAGFNVTLTMWALSYWQAASILTGTTPYNTYQRAKNTLTMDDIAKRLRGVIAQYDGSTMIGQSIGKRYDGFLTTVA